MSILTQTAVGARLLDRLLAALQPVAPLLTRLVFGQAFLLTGLGKWRNFEQTTTFFTGLGIPLPEANAALVSTVELVGGLCLLLGLRTRIAAMFLASTMVVALLTADRSGFVAALLLRGEQGLTDITPFVYLMFLVWLMAHGSGPLSIDRFLERRSSARMVPGLVGEPA